MNQEAFVVDFRIQISNIKFTRRDFIRTTEQIEYILSKN